MLYDIAKTKTINKYITTHTYKTSFFV